MTGGPAMNLQELTAANAAANLNRLFRFEVVLAADGEAELQMPWSDDLTQYAGHLHAGAIAALLDTACGFAAATLIGPVTASHFSMNCLRPAVGRGFIAKGATVRAGRKQTFARAELFAEDGSGKRSLVATGETLLVALG
ncbi:phenylacetic acid degradation protein [Bradyrhizobium sp. CCBAU 53351]|uniref:PaaI family thioesterase n=1 Tax=Bradyrhizobium sp. CCBAU 53351 TaxID=1325114 RepID=UPI0018878F9C|nr:PaaI family thioesterase [Bradyrhizobium sp. CCBAU 53351]QOZ80527.1 phenylacetic acid degradation protein [Bradyrhizobium sp. CCBAU 53351]